jgi:thiol:disulfide interchange protein
MVSSQPIYTVFRYLLALCLLLPLAATAANGGFAGSNPTSGSLFGNNQQQEFLPVEEAYVLTPRLEEDRIVLHWNIAPGYYLYQDKFKITQHSGGETETLEPLFEPGKRIFDEYFNKELTVYYHETDVVVPLTQSTPFRLSVQSQGCADAGLCYPPRTQYFQVEPQAQNIREIASLESGTAEAAAPPTPTPTLESDVPFLPWVLLAALLGGVILNLMPCVFPVLSLKALSFASSHLSRHKQHVHGWAYAAGIIVSFLVAAVIMLIAREAGQTVGWGFQLQSPVFVSIMAYLFFAMSLSLLGLFQLGTRLMGVGQSLTSGHGLRASFFTGVLAALVASPCTAPLMATALGFAMTQPGYVALAVFAALGLGMALPFLVLSYSPQLVRRLPQPGPWMESLKQLLAFPLLLTSVWLLWVLGHQVGSDAVVAILAGALAIAFGCWLWQKAPRPPVLRSAVRATAVASVLLAFVLAIRVSEFGSRDPGQWQPYTPATLTELRAQNTPVFINVTADWCITCLANDRVALDTEKVEKEAESLGVVMLKADWTNTDPNITALLKEFGRSGVPLYLVYPADPRQQAEVLPQVLTPKIVIEAMRRAANSAEASP